MAASKARDGQAAVAPAKAPELQHTEATCRAQEILTRIGDKWSLHVIHVLSADGTLRFGVLLRRVPGISQRMLTVTLRGLERDGLVHRTMYPEVPPRVEYAVTPLGATLREIVRSLVVWSSAHLAEVDAARARYDQQEPGWGVGDGKLQRPQSGSD
jgi:DNA-binding HxlR family transcriptional regulator